MVPDVSAMVQRAVTSVDFASPDGPGGVAKDVFEFVTNPQFFVLMGMEDGSAKALAFGSFPSSHLFPFPVISLIYNEGSLALGIMLKKAIFSTITEAGYSKAWAINGSGHSDKAWKRAVILSDYGKAKRIGTVFELSVN
jgi:hypothetical protein